MTQYLIESAVVREAVTGEANPALVGQPIVVVDRGTTTPVTILERGTLDPIPGSELTVTAAFTLPPFILDDTLIGTAPEDLYLDWYDAGSGASGPIGFEAVMREIAVASRDAAETAEAAASASAASAAILADDAVKSVNGVGPDAAGNVNIPGGGGDGSGLMVLDTGAPVPAGTPSDTVIFRRTPAVQALEVIEASRTSFAGSTDSISITPPADTATGDLIVLVVAAQNTGAVWTPPGDWQTLTSFTSGDARSMFVFALPVTGAPPVGPVSVVGSAGVGRVVASMFRVTGADLTTPLLAAGALSSRVDNVVTVPALAGSAGGLVLSIAGVNVGGGSPLTQPMAWSNGMEAFASVTTSTSTAVARTTLDVAWTTAVSDLASHTITAAGAVSAMGGFAVAIRGAA